MTVFANGAASAATYAVAEGVGSAMLVGSSNSVEFRLDCPSSGSGAEPAKKLPPEPPPVIAASNGA